MEEVGYEGRSTVVGARHLLPRLGRRLARVVGSGEASPAMIESTSGPERLIGRDVLNRCRVPVDGPAGQTIFD